MLLTAHNFSRNSHNTTFSKAHKKLTMKPTENLSMNAEAVAESLYAMIQRELSPHSCSCHGGYLDPSDPTIMITVDDREQLVDWCYGLVDYCQYSRETVASAMEMVDRFLSMSTPSNSVDAARERDEILKDPCKFQLLIIAAVYCSIKINEPTVLSSDLLSIICSHRYTSAEIEDMEHKLLCGLSWRCYAPTAQQVGYSILSLVLPHVDISQMTWSLILDEMLYLIELAVQDYYLSMQRASTIALAAIFNVMSDTRTKECKKDFKALLSVIMDCFDLDQSDQIQAARRRLRSFTHADGDTDVENIASDDDSELLIISGRIIKVSNKSCSHQHIWNTTRFSDISLFE